MELSSLHPLPDGAAEAFLQVIRDTSPNLHSNTHVNFATETWFRRIAGNREPRPNDVSFGFAAYLAASQPVFATPGLSLSYWEARVDRGAGMLMRPPSRLFIEAGLDPSVARAMPIRIESADGLMGGCYIPARLAGQFMQRLDQQLERSVRRMVDAEMNAAELMAVMYEAARYALSNEMGLYEAVDLLDPSDRATWPPGAVVVSGSKDRRLLERIRAAEQPPKEPGLIARLFRRRES
jgi:hypothetical protein